MENEICGNGCKHYFWKDRHESGPAWHHRYCTKHKALCQSAVKIEKNCFERFIEPPPKDNTLTSKIKWLFSVHTCDYQRLMGDVYKCSLCGEIKLKRINNNGGIVFRCSNLEGDDPITDHEITEMLDKHEITEMLDKQWQEKQDKREEISNSIMGIDLSKHTIAGVTGDLERAFGNHWNGPKEPKYIFKGGYYSHYDMELQEALAIFSKKLRKECL